MPAENRPILLARLAAIPDRVGEALQRAEGSPQPEGEWSLRTLLAHLLAVENEVWQSRLRQMALEDNPHWQWTEPDLAGWEDRLASQSLAGLLGLFASARQVTCQHLHTLTEAGWARPGTHAKFGVLEVAGLCERILEHDEEHLADLNKRGA